MGLIHRALFTWTLFALFILLTTLKLDGKSEWDWLFVFTPMWILDGVVALMLLLKRVQHIRHRRDMIASTHIRNNILCLICLLSKISFQALLCVRLEYLPSMPFAIIMIPIWSFLISAIVYFSYVLFGARSSLNYQL